MPIFEYRCNSCLEDFEDLVFDATPPICPHCHSANTSKILSKPCAYRSEHGAESGEAAPVSRGGGCSGCSGGSCATCGG